MNKKETWTTDEVIELISELISTSIEDPEGVIENLIEELSDDNLSYNTETHYFDYIGPDLPA